MKIFVMPAIFPREENKQLGIYIYEQCQALKRYGEELTILDSSAYSINNWNKCNKKFMYDSDVGKVYVNHCKGFMQSRFPRYAVWSYLKNVKKIFEEAIEKEGKPDLIYAHFTFPCGFVAKYLSEKYGIPYAVQEHYSLFLQKDLSKYLKNITKETINGAMSYFCVSEKLKNNIERFTEIRGKISVVNNMVNPRYKFSEPNKTENFIFFAAGNLVKSKKFDLLIQAFSRAFGENSKIELRIAGDGEEKENLLKLLKDSKGNINLLGRLSTDEMVKEYQKCHCFVLLSEYETFGIVYREALATGRPIISAKNGGIEEKWSDAFGILIEKNDLSQSIKALSDMVSDYQNYDLKNISEMTLKSYSDYKIYQEIKNQFSLIYR